MGNHTARPPGETDDLYSSTRPRQYPTLGQISISLFWDTVYRILSIDTYLVGQVLPLGQKDQNAESLRFCTPATTY